MMIYDDEEDCDDYKTDGDDDNDDKNDDFVSKWRNNILHHRLLSL